MKLIFLHGSPAVGKLTVAKALLRRTQAYETVLLARLTPGRGTLAVSVGRN